MQLLPGPLASSPPTPESKQRSIGTTYQRPVKFGAILLTTEGLGHHVYKGLSNFLAFLYES